MGIVIEGTLSELDVRMLYEAVSIARHAKAEGNHPFGALVADREGNVLVRAGNDHRDSPALHAETKALLEAGRRYGRDILSLCTLYTTAEPCVMCAGAMYWTGVPRLVYGISEKQLLALTGDNAENPTFSLDCRTVFRSGQKEITVVGPVDDPQLIAAIIADHKGFWR
ncbi:MAG: nucleoside deaminase [Sphaerochaetaceae bacterium]|jgi:tRNA(Arg) A34 adenosine deaminase TadA